MRQHQRGGELSSFSLAGSAGRFVAGRPAKRLTLKVSFLVYFQLYIQSLKGVPQQQEGNSMRMDVCDWAAETKAGREEADALIARMKATRCPLEMVRHFDPKASASGFEVGFLHRIAEQLLLS